MRSHLQKFIIPASLGLLLLAPACTCQPPTHLRIGMMRSAGCNLLSLAAQQHLFEQQALQVEIISLESPAQAKTELMKKPFDLFCSSLIDVLLAPKESDYKIILVSDYSNGADVLIARKDAGTALIDLKGARIGIMPASVGELLLDRALSANGLSRDDFTVLSEDAAGLQDALQKSEIQMAVASPPLSLDILKNPDMQVIYQSSSMPGDIINTLSAPDRLLQQSPDLVRKIEDIWNQALQYTEQHPNEAFEFLARGSSLPVVTVRRDYKFLPMAEQSNYLRGDGRLTPLIEQLQTILLQNGSLKIKQDPRLFLFVPTKK